MKKYREFWLANPDDRDGLMKYAHDNKDRALTSAMNNSAVSCGVVRFIEDMAHTELMVEAVKLRDVLVAYRETSGPFIGVIADEAICNFDKYIKGS